MKHFPKSVGFISFLYMEMRREKKDKLEDYWRNLVQVHKYFFLSAFLYFFLTHWASRQHLWCLTKLLPTCLFHLRKASVESLFFTCKKNKNKMPPSSDINCCSVGCCCFFGNSHYSGASRSFKGQFAAAAATAAATCVLYTHTRMVALQMSDFRLENLGSTGCTVRLDHQYTLKKKKKTEWMLNVVAKEKKKRHHTHCFLLNRGRLRSPGWGSLFFFHCTMPFI